MEGDILNLGSVILFSICQSWTRFSLCPLFHNLLLLNCQRPKFYQLQESCNSIPPKCRDLFKKKTFRQKLDVKLTEGEFSAAPYISWFFKKKIKVTFWTQPLLFDIKMRLFTRNWHSYILEYADNLSLLWSLCGNHGADSWINSNSRAS